MKPPTTKKELQCLIGKINFVRRFISNLSGRIEPFMGLVKIKSDEEFCWGAEQQQAFDEIKEYLTKPPVLVPPQQDRTFYIYLSVADTSIASVVVQVYDGLEKVVFYLSRRMLDAETSPILVPNLKAGAALAVAAFVVAVVAVVGAAAGDVFIALLKPPGGASSSSSSSSSQAARKRRRRVLFGGGVVLRFVLLVGGEVRAPGEGSSSLPSSKAPSTRKWRSSSPSVKESSSSDSTEKSQSLSSHHSGARASYALIGSYSGIGSLEEEDWKERPEEAEEEESMAEEGGFFEC
ncbi:hypothetical protein QYE76_028149 [Lolium multiflorum]|uniref:Reverse transcriptase/retrotransposon-derived protein RNase H-like domain-containing protein n=1 Tax=Lolium multiflorum TaxID=4521 RepID=A0AAD8VGQ5_LOLMU|nr:hypothetical protein QYE76_028149 [Lolium multiflorum]